MPHFRPPSTSATCSGYLRNWTRGVGIILNYLPSQSNTLCTADKLGQIFLEIFRAHRMLLQCATQRTCHAYTRPLTTLNSSRSIDMRALHAAKSAEGIRATWRVYKRSPECTRIPQRRIPTQCYATRPLLVGMLTEVLLNRMY